MSPIRDTSPDSLGLVTCAAEGPTKFLELVLGL